jgi:hypothetical protein
MHSKPAYKRSLSLSLFTSLFIRLDIWMHLKPAYKRSLYFALYTAGYLNAFKACLQARSLLRSLYGWISECIQSLPTSALSLSLFTSLFIRLDIWTHLSSPPCVLYVLAIHYYFNFHPSLITRSNKSVASINMKIKFEESIIILLRSLQCPT